ncbi:hypothetical protein BDP27DRAFT_1372302 [Rhodocollybia butyracea]|uniref:Uncharacterized protein n=1 Tax=Rhodocollybia butyracea TaxID=206335 RepID=A0A9P5PAH0_9AGAR|nr:hypothetical protein BDP27DRAFT_1372302 [Rhodocollybia butyracea]
MRVKPVPDPPLVANLEFANDKTNYFVGSIRTVSIASITAFYCLVGDEEYKPVKAVALLADSSSGGIKIAGLSMSLVTDRMKVIVNLALQNEESEVALDIGQEVNRKNPDPKDIKTKGFNILNLLSSGQDSDAAGKWEQLSNSDRQSTLQQYEQAEGHREARGIRDVWEVFNDAAGFCAL